MAAAADSSRWVMSASHMGRAGEGEKGGLTSPLGVHVCFHVHVVQVPSSNLALLPSSTREGSTL